MGSESAKVRNCTLINALHTSENFKKDSSKLKEISKNKGRNFTKLLMKWLNHWI